MMTTMAVYTAQSLEHMYFICKLVPREKGCSYS